MEPLRLTRRQSREVDRIAIEEYGFPSIVLMENAARSAVDAMADLLVAPRHIGVLCGPGNNGGDGLAVARHLANGGHRIRILLTAPTAAFTGDAGVNLRIAQAIGLSMNEWPGKAEDVGIFAEPLDQFELVVDALFGTGLNRPVAGDAAKLIAELNHRIRPEMPVVSLDIPSGLDGDTGRPLGACVRATMTVTFGTEKVGFDQADAKAFLGRVVVGSIGIPRAVFVRASEMAARVD